jgi:hypothetical protein
MSKREASTDSELYLWLVRFFAEPSDAPVEPEVKR